LKGDQKYDKNFLLKVIEDLLFSNSVTILSKFFKKSNSMQIQEPGR